MKPINGWTKERIIEQIKTNMLDHKSSLNGMCRYRTPDGNKCAVGCFIPDEVYLNQWEACGVRSVWPYIESNMPLDLDSMIELQYIHDSYREGGDPRPKLVAWIERNVE